MDEPSTGLDPASRYNLWNVVKQSKQDRAIILTSRQLATPLLSSLYSERLEIDVVVLWGD